MAINNGLLVAQVVHTRHRPKYHHLQYHVYYLCVALSDFALLNRLSILRHNKFGLFSFYDRDHAPSSESPEAWIRSVMKDWQLEVADGEIVLLTMPRLLGYGFNPVSFWFCLDRAGALRAVLAEVRNTFGEKHCYWVFHEDRRPITQDDWITCQKVFHVSPFIEVTGQYQFRFAYAPDKVGVWIDFQDEAGTLLTTSLVGKRSKLSSGSLLRCFFRYPLVTVQVIALIHYHAIRLVLKGIRYRRKPAPPPTEISR